MKIKDVYAKHYGLGDEFRLLCIADSLLMGVKRAAKKRNVAEGSIYKWRRDYVKALMGVK